MLGFIYKDGLVSAGNRIFPGVRGGFAIELLIIERKSAFEEMTVPATYSAFRRGQGENTEAIIPSIERTPSLQSSEVLIRIHAVSLNYRDVGMLHGRYPVSVKYQGIPASDCAGEVIAVGSAVSKVSLGDRVSPIFDLRYIDGVDPESKVAQLGGNIDGVLRQYAVFDESVLVHIPPHLSWAEVCRLKPVHSVTLFTVAITYRSYPLLELD